MKNVHVFVHLHFTFRFVCVYFMLSPSFLGSNNSGLCPRHSVLLWKVARDLCREFRHQWKLLVRGVSNLFDVHPFVGSENCPQKRLIRQSSHPWFFTTGMSFMHVQEEVGDRCRNDHSSCKNASETPKPRISSLVITHNSLVSHRCRFKQTVFNAQNDGKIYQITDATFNILGAGSTSSSGSFVTGGQNPLLTRNGLGLVDDLNVVELDLGDVIH